MSSYDYSLLLWLWSALFAIVVALVVARVVPRIVGAVAIVAILIACPVLDPGFFWTEWGSADATPGHGFWTACWLAITGLILLYPSPARGTKSQVNPVDAVDTAHFAPKSRSNMGRVHPHPSGEERT
jgi:hypothetical protein